MALNKLALGLIAGVVSVGVIGGVAAAVVTSNNSIVMNPEDGKSGEAETGMRTDSGKNPDQNNPTINLEQIVNNFKAEDIVLTDNAMKDDTYAFNVKKEQLALKPEAIKDLQAGVSVEIDSINNTENGALLNQGKLSVTLKASLKDKPEQEAKRSTVELEGFKVSSPVLTKYLSVQTEESKTAVLDLTKPKNTSTQVALTTIEALNEVKQTPSRRTRALSDPAPVVAQTPAVSGLNNLFQIINKPMGDDETTTNELKTITVEGKVKLEKVTKQEETNISLFHLVSVDSTKPLKLIETKQEKEKSEALVNEVVVTNLLASNIKLNFKGYEEKEQAEFLKKYQEAASSSMFTYDMQKGLSFELKKEPSGGEKITVKFNPVVIKRTAKEQELETNLAITFGSGDESKTYSTDKENDLKELKDSGITFYVYAQNLKESDETLTLEKINKTDFKLGTYLNEASTSTGVETTMLEEMQQMKNPIGGFSLIKSTDETFKTDFSIGKVMTVMTKQPPRDPREGDLDTPNETWVNENWISFVGYSFKAGLDKKVLFIPTINLVHVAETKATDVPGQPAN